MPASDRQKTPMSRFLLPRRPDRWATATPTRPRSHDAPPSSAARCSSQPQRRISRFAPSWTQSQATPARQTDDIDEGSSSPPAPPTWRARERPGQPPQSSQPSQPLVQATQTPSAPRVLWKPRWQSARHQQMREDIEEAEDSDLDMGAGETGSRLPHMTICDAIEEGESEEESEEQPQLLSAARPFKRRRLFVSPGKVASSPPPDGLSDEEDHTERFRRLIDEIDDGGEDDYHDEDRNQESDHDEIRDILEDDALLESWDKSGGHAHGDAYDSEEEDFLILAASPRRTKTRDGQHHPTLQHAQLFLTARQQHGGGVLDEGGENGERNDDLNDYEEENDHRDHAGVDLQQKHYQNPPPDFFSPQKRHKKRGRLPQQKNGTATGADTGQFVAGGLAAELRDWLVQIKVQTRSSGSGQTRYVVDEAQTSSGMCLVLGHQQSAETETEAETNPQRPLARLLLAGLRPLVPSDGDGSAVLVKGRVVVLMPPVWNVVLGGQTWTVASDWAVE